MAITTAISDFIKSIYELLASILSTAYAVVSSTVSAILNFFAGLFDLLGNIVSGMVDVAGGVGKFVAGTFLAPLFPLSIPLFRATVILLDNSCSEY